MRSVKIENESNAFASTLNCEIAIKFPLNFEFSSDAGDENLCTRAWEFFAGAGGEKTQLHNTIE